MADREPDDIADLLRECEESLTELKETHRLVQDGGKAFSELASRLRIEMERRSGADRRDEGRPVDDRGTPKSNSA